MNSRGFAAGKSEVLAAAAAADAVGEKRTPVFKLELPSSSRDNCRWGVQNVHRLKLSVFLAVEVHFESIDRSLLPLRGTDVGLRHQQVEIISQTGHERQNRTPNLAVLDSVFQLVDNGHPHILESWRRLPFRRWKKKLGNRVGAVSSARALNGNTAHVLRHATRRMVCRILQGRALAPVSRRLVPTPVCPICFAAGI